jgi:hypothetical protein
MLYVGAVELSLTACVSGTPGRSLTCRTASILTGGYRNEQLGADEVTLHYSVGSISREAHRWGRRVLERHLYTREDARSLTN